MALEPDDPAVPTAQAAALHPALAEVVNSVGEKLTAALAHSSRASQFEARRQMEQALGRKLEPLFALELLTFLLAQGTEGRELRVAFSELLRMTESSQWKDAMLRNAPAGAEPDDAAEFLASEDAASVQELARCGECLARGASKGEAEGLTHEAAANRQWTLCALCRTGSGAWYQR